MQQHNANARQSQDYSSVMQLLSAIERGRFRIPSGQEVMSAKSKEVQSGITGSKSADSLLKTSEQKQDEKAFLNHVSDNMDARSA